jgi:hypothetical protein
LYKITKVSRLGQSNAEFRKEQEEWKQKLKEANRNESTEQQACDQDEGNSKVEARLKARANH